MQEIKKRHMEFTAEERIKWNDCILGCLKEFIRLCEKYGLTYYAIGGTAIGAVRHNGLIPWDDDIDIGMPRKDYERFSEICTKENLGNYEFLTPAIKGYPYPFGKFCDKRTTILERRNVHAVYGLFVDIFPIDGTSSNRSEALRLLKCYRRWFNKLNAVLTRYTFWQYLSLIKAPSNWGRMAWQTMAVIIGRENARKFIIHRLKLIEKKYDYDNSEYLVNYNGCYFDREIFPSTWAKATIDHVFEDTTIKLLCENDAYLSNVYGDYMQLPPPEKRICQHDHAFHSLDARFSLKEILKRIK